MLSWLLRGLFNSIWRASAFLIILFAIYVSVGRQVVPLVSNYRLEVAGILSQQLGTSVTIGQMEGYWSGVVPALQLVDVYAGPDFQIGEIRVELSPFTSIANGKITTSYIEISDVKVKLKQTEGGWQLSETGLLMTGAADSNRSFLDVIQPVMDQDRIFLENLELSVEIPELPELTVQIPDGLIESFGGNRNLEVNANIWSGTESAEISLIAETELLLNGALDARVYLSQSSFNWAPWASLVDLPFDTESLVSDADLWLEFENNDLISIQSRIQVPEMTLVKDETKIDLRDISTELTIEKDGEIYQAWLKDLGFELSGDVWEPSLHLMHWNGQSLEIISDRLEMSLVSDLAELVAPALPLDTINPRGLLLNSRVNWNNTENPIPEIIIQGRFENLSTEAWEGAPGVGGVNGYVDIAPQQGKVTILPSNASLHLPEIFTTELDFQDLQGEVNWRWNPDYGLFLSIDSLTAQHQGADNIKTEFTLVAPGIGKLKEDRKGRLNLSIAFENLEQEYMQSFIPELLDPHTIDWINTSVTSGVLDSGMVQVTAPLVSADFINSTALLDFQASDVNLKFLPDWPAVQNMEGRFGYSSEGVVAEVYEGSFYGANFNNALVKINNDDTNTLYLDGLANGDAGDLLNLFRDTPLRVIVEDSMDGWQARGPVFARLSAEIPFDDREVTATIDADFAGTDLIIEEFELAAFNLQGDLKYNEQQGLYSTGMTGDFFGHKTQFALSMVERADAQTHILISADGKADIKSLGYWLDDPLIYDLEGTASYSARVDIYESATEIELSTDLTGIELPFPYPLTKSSSEAWPLDFFIQFYGEDETYIKAALNNAYSAEFRMTGSLIEYGHITTGLDSQLPDENGIFIDLEVDKTDGDYWWDEIERISLLYDSWVYRESDEDLPDFDELIKEVNIKAKSLVYLDTPWANFSAVANRSEEAWTGEFKSDQAQGVIGFGHEIDDPIILDLDFVSVTTEDEETDPEVYIDPLQEVDPTEIPPMIVQVKRLILDEEDWGGWSFVSNPVEGGIQIENVKGIIRGLNVFGGLNWTLTNDGKHKSESSFKVEVGDVGTVLENWGYAQNFRSESGEVDVDLSWPASPMGWEYFNLNGKVDLDVRNGRVVNVEEIEGIKIVGIFNFSRILKRLSLDFSDIVQDGITFDSIKGDLLFSDGYVMVGDKFEMNGATTKLKFNGGYDLLDENLDIDMVVTIPLNETLPLVALLAGVTPQMALAFFIGERVFNNQVEKFFSAKYRITGTLDNPDYQLYRAFDNNADPRKPEFVQ